MTITETTQATAAEPPVVHFLAAMPMLLSASSTGAGRMFQYGQELTVTDEIRRANADRNGRSRLADWLDGTEDVLTVNGTDVLARGPWPEGTCRLLPGSYAWEDARQRDIQDTWTLPDLDARAARRREIDSYYGRPEATSRTLQTVTGEDSR